MSKVAHITIDPDNRMTVVPKTAPIDLSTWKFNVEGFSIVEQALSNIIGAAAAEALESTLENFPPVMSFGYEHGPKHNGLGGKAPKDPATIYIGLPLGKDDEASVWYECSLEKAIDSVIELHLEGGFPTTDVPKAVTDKQGRQVCSRIAARLRELADKLDKACEP